MKENDCSPTVKMFRNVIIKMEKPLMKLCASHYFENFNVLDLMEMIYMTFHNMSGRTCNRILSGLNEARYFAEYEHFPCMIYKNSSRSPDGIINDIIDASRIIAGASGCVLQDIRLFIPLIQVN